MALTESNMLALGTPAPDFSLSDTDGSIVRLQDFAQQRALVVMFICNHCPFVRHLRLPLAEFAEDYADEDVAIVAISANDVSSHPQDGPEEMAREKLDAGYIFPYLYDESQNVARAYAAACTPDFYVYDEDRGLVYRGQFDDSRPNNSISPNGADLRHAVNAVLAGRPVTVKQKPSMGCNIKWKR